MHITCVRLACVYLYMKERFQFSSRRARALPETRIEMLYLQMQSVNFRYMNYYYYRC